MTEQAKLLGALVRALARARRYGISEQERLAAVGFALAKLSRDEFTEPARSEVVYRQPTPRMIH